MSTSYQEFSPSPALQPFVECYWLHAFTTQGQQESPVQRCMPFGALELILHLDDNHAYAQFNDTWQQLPKAFFVGLYRDTVHWKAVGTSRKFGIRLKPESLLQLFNVPVASLFNQFTDLETFLGKETNRLIERVQDVADIDQVIEAAESFLLAQFKNLTRERNYLYEATRLIRQEKGNVSIEALSERLSVSKRQLERSFKDNYGTTPKLYSASFASETPTSRFSKRPLHPTGWMCPILLVTRTRRTSSGILKNSQRMCRPCFTRIRSSFSVARVSI